MPRLLILTKPLHPPAASFTVTPQPEQLVASWAPPPGRGHTHLAGYRLLVTASSGRLVAEVSTPRQQTAATLTRGVRSGEQYCVALASVAADRADPLRPLESVSDYIQQTVVTPPPPPTSLSLEAAHPSSLKIQWAAPGQGPARGKLSYSLSIAQATPGAGEQRTREAEVPRYLWTQLVSGTCYRVTVRCLLTLASGAVSLGPAAEAVFTTRPLPPEQLRARGGRVLAWGRSPSRTVGWYKLKLRRARDKAADHRVEAPGRGEEVTFQLPPELEPGAEYKLNIYSVVAGAGVESEPLFSKITLQQTEGGADKITIKLCKCSNKL